MKITTKNFIHKGLVFLLIFISHSMYAQDVKIDSKKMYNNSLNISIGPGGILMFYLPASIYYERMFQGKLFGPKISSITDVGFGLETHWGGGGSFYMGRYGILTGNGKHHLEAKVGAVYFTDLGLNPSFALGYSSQKPQSHFIFRTGVGWPEALYVSWGFSF